MRMPFSPSRRGPVALVAFTLVLLARRAETYDALFELSDGARANNRARAGRCATSSGRCSGFLRSP